MNTQSRCLQEVMKPGDGHLARSKSDEFRYRAEGMSRRRATSTWAAWAWAKVWRLRLHGFVALVIALSAGPASGQTSSSTAAQVGPGVPGGVPPGYAAPAPSPGFFGALGGACQGLMKHCKQSPLKQLLKNTLKPLSAATGGMIGGGPHGSGAAVPPAPAAAKPPPPPPAVKAAAKIKAEAKTLKARREAVRYLGTLDCHWYPEAEAGLIAALRADRNECIRLEAALALRQRCCCTKKTMAALQIAASGSNRDGNPGERCVRVRWAALEALQACLLQCTTEEFEQRAPRQRPETPDRPLKSPDQDALTQTNLAAPDFYRRVDSIRTADLVAAAERTLAVLSRPREPVEAEPTAPPANLQAIWTATDDPSASAATYPSDATKKPLGQPGSMKPNSASGPRPNGEALPRAAGSNNPAYAPYPVTEQVPPARAAEAYDAVGP